MKRHSINLEYIRYKRTNIPKLSKKEVENYYRAISTDQKGTKKPVAII